MVPDHSQGEVMDYMHNDKARCFGLHYIPSTIICWSSSPSISMGPIEIIRFRGVCEAVGDRFHDEIRPFIDRDGRVCSLLPTKWGNSKKMAYTSQKGSSHQNLTTLAPCSWASRLQNYKNSNFCCLSHLVCDILLWHPKVTKTQSVLHEILE